jgi:hypothetical protein
MKYLSDSFFHRRARRGRRDYLRLSFWVFLGVLCVLCGERLCFFVDQTARCFGRRSACGGTPEIIPANALLGFIHEL